MWQGNYIYVDRAVQQWYKKMRPFIAKLTDFCSKRSTIFRNQSLENLLTEYNP